MDITSAIQLIKRLPVHIPVHLKGQPGIGKTFGVHKLIKDTNARGYVFLACTMDPTDMSGLPMRTEQGFTAFAPPEWAYELSTKNVDYQGPAVAFFDDLTTADQHVQAAFFRFVHERAVGNWKIRDNVRIMSAGNREEDKAAVRGMPTPLKNRFLHIDIDLSPEGWRRWAINAGVFPHIIAYIQSQEQSLNTFNPARNDYAFATPRTWHMLSDCLTKLNGDVDNNFEVIKGLVGEGVALEFQAFNRNTQAIKSPKEILADPEGVELPDLVKDIDIVYATITSLAVHLGQNVKPKNILKTFKYAKRLNAEFSTLLLGDVHDTYLNSEGLSKEERVEIAGTEEFAELVEKLDLFID